MIQIQSFQSKMGCDNSVECANNTQSDLIEPAKIQTKDPSKNTPQNQTNKQTAVLSNLPVTSIQKEGEDLNRLIQPGLQLQKNGNYNQALKIYNQLQAKYPKNPTLCLRKGVCCRLLKNYDEALIHYFNGLKFGSKDDKIYFGIGLIYKLKENFDESYKYYKMAQQANPNEPMNFNGMGNLYLDVKKDNNEAIRLFKKAHEINPKYQTALSNLGIVYFNSKNYKQSINAYQKVIAINPKNEGYYFSQSLNYKNQNLFEEAKKLLLKALQVNNKYSPAYNTLGNIELSLQNNLQAKKYFLKSIQCNPNNRLPYNGLGNALYANKQYKQAIQSYKKSIKIDPKYSTPYSGQGDALKELGQLDKSIQSYLECIRLDPKDSNPYNGLGNVYKVKGDLDESIKWLKKAIQVDPNNEQPYNGLGNALKEKKNYKQAIQSYQKSISIKPKFNFPYNGLANVYYAMKDYVNAQKIYRKCLQVDPKYDRPYNNLGNMYDQQGKAQLAIQMYKKAIDLNPKSEAAYNGLALQYIKKKEYQKGIQAYKQAIKIQPQYTLAYINLSMAYISLRNYQEAFSCLKTSRSIIENAKIDVFFGTKDFITGQIQKFQREMGEWEYKIKRGYLTKEDENRIQKMKEDFQNKFKNIFNTDQENSSFDPKKINQNFLEVLEKIFKDKFMLMNDQQIAQSSFILFREDMDQFSILAFLFCQFFWTQKRNKLSILQIQASLEGKLKVLCDKFPPSNSKPQTVTINLIQQVPEKKINLFGNIQYFQNYMYLVKQIEIIHQSSKNVLSKFRDFVNELATPNGGFNTRANLKLPDNESERFKVYIRVMEKMFKQIGSRKNQIIAKVQAKLAALTNSNMQAVITFLVEVWTEEISFILKTRSSKKIPTHCFISDFVRGKSMFKGVKQIESAANKIITVAKTKGYEITEIDNRLEKQTKDLVLKIKIDDIVCQYQMALEFDATQYHFSHSLYEIRRSPLGCIFGSYLFLSKFKSLTFLRQAREILNHYNGQQSSPETIKIIESAKFLIGAFELNK